MWIGGAAQALLCVVHRRRKSCGRCSFSVDYFFFWFLIVSNLDRKYRECSLGLQWAKRITRQLPALWQRSVHICRPCVHDVPRWLRYCWFRYKSVLPTIQYKVCGSPKTGGICTHSGIPNDSVGLLPLSGLRDLGGSVLVRGLNLLSWSNRKMCTAD